MTPTSKSTFLARIGLGVALVGILAASSTITGCIQQPSSQTSVNDNPAPLGLTPVQKGVVRREALIAAKAGFDAFLTSDAKQMKPYFKPYYVTYYDKLYAQYAKEGKKRVRKVEIKSMDVSDMNNTGKQVLVDVQFVDNQYYADLSGKPITKPEGKETYIQLTLNKKDGTWSIDNMIGTGTVLK